MPAVHTGRWRWAVNVKQRRPHHEPAPPPSPDDSVPPPADADRAFLDAWDLARFRDNEDRDLCVRGKNRPEPGCKQCRCLAARNRPTPDGQRCIQCRVPARDGRIAHLKTCADYRGGSLRNALETNSGPWAPGADRYAEFVAQLVPGRRRDRYDCPECGAPGDGHGV